jgi:hypothetical protein
MDCATAENPLIILAPTMAYVSLDVCLCMSMDVCLYGRMSLSQLRRKERMGRASRPRGPRWRWRTEQWPRGRRLTFEWQRRWGTSSLGKWYEDYRGRLIISPLGDIVDILIKVFWIGLAAWHSGHCVRLQNIRSRVQIPQGCIICRSLYIAVLLSET